MGQRARLISSPRVVNVDDLRRVADRRLPRVIFDYVDGGAEAEITLRDNRRVFDTVRFRPRNGVAIEGPDLGAVVLGRRTSMPLLLAPCGFTRLVHPDGELAVARAARAAGIGYVLSTMSGYKLEDVAEAHSCGPLWYQLYLVGGRAVAEAAIERARVSGFTTLVITIDTATAGIRERDIRNGSAVLMGDHRFAVIPFVPQLLAHPRWLISYLLDGGPTTFPNIVIPGRGPMLLREVRAALGQAAVTWSDFRWIREMWPGPVAVKGVLTGDDARRSIDEGAAAVIVSNHGGRQLDGVPASLGVLPEIVQAVGGRAEILMDGGIRRGSDVVKAICLGARSVLIGRAYMYGLAAAGEAGVRRALDILRDDVRRTMTLLGCTTISELNRSYVDLPMGWPD